MDIHTALLSPKVLTFNISTLQNSIAMFFQYFCHFAKKPSCRLFPHCFPTQDPPTLGRGTMWENISTHNMHTWSLSKWVHDGNISTARVPGGTWQAISLNIAWLLGNFGLSRGSCGFGHSSTCENLVRCPMDKWGVGVFPHFLEKPGKSFQDRKEHKRKINTI